MYKKTEARWCYIMLLLPMIGFIVFSVYPILWTMRWSFYSYTGVDKDAVFIGARNFVTLFKDSTYWESWLTTLQFTIMKVPLEMVLALGLAMLLMKKGLKGVGIFRAVYYLPNVLGAAVVGVILTNMFTYFGVINDILVEIGLISSPIDWYSSKSLAMIMLVIGSIWNSFGVNVMYFMSALANVPQELYECAAIDGASTWVKFTRITLPIIAPVFSTVLLLAVLGTLSTNEYILAFSGGAPGGSTNTVMSYMTQQFVPGFSGAGVIQIGYGCAMGLVTTIIFVFVGLLHNKISKNKD